MGTCTMRAFLTSVATESLTLRCHLGFACRRSFRVVCFHLCLLGGASLAGRLHELNATSTLLRLLGPCYIRCQLRSPHLSARTRIYANTFKDLAYFWDFIGFCRESIRLSGKVRACPIHDRICASVAFVAPRPTITRAARLM